MSGQAPTRPPSLIWEDPPPIRKPQRASKWKPTIEALRQRPGRWAKVRAGLEANSADSLGQTLRRAGCETCRRVNGEGYSLYARWPERGA